MLGVLFLVFSEYHSNKEEPASVCGFDESAYKEELEGRLKEMIGAVSGDENAHVLITLESTALYCYAEGETGLYSAEKGLLFQETASGGKAPVLKEIRAPAIKGVSVVCKGGKSDALRHEIISLIASTLHLPKNRIYVTE